MRGISIAGRMGAGKDWLYSVLARVYPQSRQVTVSSFVWREAIRTGLIPEDAKREDKAKYRKQMQAMGSKNPGGRFQTAVKATCKLHQISGHLPIITDVRTSLDEQMNLDLGFPLIVCTAPESVRIKRIMERDGATEQEVKATLNCGTTEAYVDFLEVDHTFINDGRHTARELSRLFRFLADCEAGRIGRVQ